MAQAIPIVRVGGRDVLATGSVVVAPGETLEITPASDAAPNLRVRIVFDRQISAGYRMDVKAEGDLVTLRFFNFNNPIGIAPLQAMPIGKVAGRILYLSYIVHAVGSDNAATRLFSFSFSAGTAAEVA